MDLNVTRRRLLQWLGAIAAYRATAQEVPLAVAPSSNGRIHEIGTQDLSLEITDDALISSLRLGSRKAPIPFRASTSLASCTQQGSTSHRDLDSGGMEFKRMLVRDQSKSACVVFDRFIPTSTSIRWEIEIVGTGEPWSTQIETQLSWLDSSHVSFWTTWDSPPQENSTEESRLMDAWNDPLKPAPFADMDLRYGGYLESHHAFSIPIATILDSQADIALSLVQSPEVGVLDMNLKTTALGDVDLIRKNLRIASGKPVKIAMDLIAHPADWRGGIGWMVERYPGYFEPINQHVYALDGCGSYAASDGNLDTAQLRKMAYSLNWNARFDFPYLGMSIPPVGPDVTWPSWYQKTVSLAEMSKYEARVEEAGFHVLDYFNTTEGGNYIQEDAPPRKAQSDADLWRDANDFIHYQVSDAVVRNRDGKMLFSNWFNNVVLDPAEPSWQQSLLQQAETLVKQLPHSSGIVIDRMDWLATYNLNRDDGMSWIDGRPARSLLNSWKEILPKLSAILHPADKVIYANCLVARLDACEYLDGLYDEYGDFPSSFNLCGFLTVHKPAIAWTRTLNSLRPNPDAFFQRHLHMGIFPTVPVPGADHSIEEDVWANQYYLDYGSLFNAIRGKRYVLKPHVVSVSEQSAHVNLFEIPGGYAVPITFAEGEQTVHVTLRNLLNGNHHIHSVKVFHPGNPEPSTIHWQSQDAEVTMAVPVVRNCAVIKISVSNSPIG